jgi:hypothetical protein
MPTNDDLNHEQSTPVDAEHPGYETTDVNVSGVAVFLAGLFGTVLIFFGVCFMLGKVINNGIQASYVSDYGEPNKWHGGPAAKSKLENLKSNPDMEQKELGQMTATFPNPRLDIDDGNQATADLHAREDLLLDHYSSISGESGTIRIPISRAMELIAQRGLPVNAATAASQQLAGDVKPEVQAPLTTGFARTGYEIDVMEARAQKMSYGKAEGSEKAELAPAKK